MASIGISSDTSVSREQLRAFHLTGRGLDALLPTGPLRPASLEQLELPRIERSYPIYFSDSVPPQPFYRLLQTVADAHPAGFPILRDCLERIAGAFGERIGFHGCVPVSSVLDDALAAAQAQMKSFHIEPQALEKEWAALRKALPTEGWLIAFGDGALIALACATLESARREARLTFAEELKEYGRRLQELLDVDDGKSEAASSTERLAASLGARATSFLVPSALAEALRRRANPVPPMEPERRARCESALATIRNAIHDLNSPPSVILIHSGRAPKTPPHFAIQYQEAVDACDAAAALCRRQLRDRVPVWKALRTARLEVDSAFGSSSQTEALEAFDESSAQPDELAALPVVMVYETAQRIEESLASFARLLQSGLPVQVLIACSNAPAGSLGFLPLAYQDAFALQTSIADTGHLIGGLSAMARTLRPAAAVVTVSESWREAALLPLARVYPLYRYHPDLGASWYERFALETNRPPQYERLNFAHAAALMPAFRNQFRVLPGAEAVDQAELAEYPADRTPHAFPFLFVVDENGGRSRAVFTREIVNLCSAAEKRWRILEELAAPKVVKEEDPDAESRSRQDGAAEAVHRVISILAETNNVA